MSPVCPVWVPAITSTCYLAGSRQRQSRTCPSSHIVLCLFESALSVTMGSLVTQLVKNMPAMWETRFDPWVGKVPWRRRNWQPTLVFLSGESHGQRSLIGYSPWGRKDSDTTEQVTLICGNRIPPALLVDHFLTKRTVSLLVRFFVALWTSDPHLWLHA